MNSPRLFCKNFGIRGLESCCGQWLADSARESWTVVHIADVSLIQQLSELLRQIWASDDFMLVCWLNVDPFVDTGAIVVHWRLLCEAELLVGTLHGAVLHYRGCLVCLITVSSTVLYCCP